MYSKILSKVSTILKKCTQFELFSIIVIFLILILLLISFVSQARLYLKLRPLSSLFEDQPASFNLIADSSSQTVNNSSPQVVPPADSTPTSFYWVDIGGAVNDPGLKRLEIGPSDPPRLYQVIELAGGWHPQVNLDYLNRSLNLAAIVEDSQKIYIPFQSESFEPSVLTAADSSQTSESPSSPFISLNTASLQELQQLTGVGEVKAKNIVNNRPFDSLEEAVASKVLSQKIVDDNADRLIL